MTDKSNSIKPDEDLDLNASRERNRILLHPFFKDFYESQFDNLNSWDYLKGMKSFDVRLAISRKAYMNYAHNPNSPVRSLLPFNEKTFLQILINKIESNTSQYWIEYKTYLQGKLVESKVEVGKLTISEIALKQAYIYLFASGKAINKANEKEFLEPYGHRSIGELVKEFKRFKDDEGRLNFCSIDKGNTSALNKHKSRYEKILPLLENYPLAYTNATKEYEKLKAK